MGHWDFGDEMLISLPGGGILISAADSTFILVLAG